jgi:hypothetical protein
MNRPQRYLFRMIAFVVIVAGACAALYPQLKDAFVANGVLNGLILGGRRAAAAFWPRAP